MTLRNRVTPFNELVADPSYRGMFMGNRGVLHDDRRTIVRWRNERRWIVCCTEFKGRRRRVMTPGLYTELFFLDDASALAAGHRPCAECRREKFNEYRWAIVKAGGRLRSAPELDAQLDRERRDGNRPRRHIVPACELPDGAMVAVGDGAYLVAEGQMRPWSTRGYAAALPLPADDVQMLTPPLSAMALRGGFVPELHPTARRQW